MIQNINGFDPIFSSPYRINQLNSCGLHGSRHQDLDRDTKSQSSLPGKLTAQQADKLKLDDKLLYRYADVLADILSQNLDDPMVSSSSSAAPVAAAVAPADPLPVAAVNAPAGAAAVAEPVAPGYPKAVHAAPAVAAAVAPAHPKAAQVPPAFAQAGQVAPAPAPHVPLAAAPHAPVAPAVPPLADPLAGTTAKSSMTRPPVTLASSRAEKKQEAARLGLSRRQFETQILGASSRASSCKPDQVAKRQWHSKWSHER